MVVSISDLQVLIEASVKAALAGQKSAAAGRLDERFFRRMVQLHGVLDCPSGDSEGMPMEKRANVVGLVLRWVCDELRTKSLPVE